MSEHFATRISVSTIKRMIEEAYNKGYEEGANVGYAEGCIATEEYAYDHGHEDGYNEGWAEAELQHSREVT